MTLRSSSKVIDGVTRGQILSVLVKVKSEIMVDDVSSEISKDSNGDFAIESCVVWLTGLSGAGKTTIGRKLTEILTNFVSNVIFFDGDEIRKSISVDLGFSEADRRENIRRVSILAKNAFDQGKLVICSFISPYKSNRDLVRDLLPDGKFIEVFVDCPVEVCRQRDVKGLYQRYFRGEISGLTGLDAPYEKPENPELILKTDQISIEEAVEQTLNCLEVY